MANHLVFLIFDSCRYDSFARANAPNMARVGTLERRWSYASWTAPAHYAFLMGMMPHASPHGVFASEVYKKEFSQWVDRLGIPNLSFQSFIPELSLPKVLQGLGYYCVARVSLPVLNPFTLLSRHFDDYRLMENHSDFAGMIEGIEFEDGQPYFYFLNLGETHYPYMLPKESLPHISGVHGVFKALADGRDPAGDDEFFDSRQMQSLHQQQIRCVEYLDSLMDRLFARCPDNTHVIITSDHGELFGEDGYFGHGPIMHEKVFEVPFIEGRVPR
ncbi:MAG: sulfatase-like hydrolase/transferase [Candidatus Competibacter sp.]|nr:sulfatase-like hydrolase/transferase [Candidatus Competibacter sp.]